MPTRKTSVKSFGDTAKSLARNPLGIIALFIVLVYGFASLVTAFAGSFSAGERLPLIWFLVLFPVLVLGVFAWLVSRHGGKLYSPSDFRDEGNYVRVQLNRLEAAVEKVGIAPPQTKQSASNAALLQSRHSDSRLAVAQTRLEVERELFLLSRFTLKDGGSPGWPVREYLECLRAERVLEPQFAESLEEFVELANTIVHGTAATDEHLERSAKLGSSLMARLHHKRLVAEMERDFGGHGLWHMRRRGPGIDEKYHFWSAVAATLPQFDYDYDVYVEAAKRHNERDQPNGGHHSVYILPLDEFVSVLEFRAQELERIIPTWGKANWDEDDIVRWQWPKEWGDIGWDGPILHERKSLWAAEEDLMRTCAAIRIYRATFQANS